MGNQRTVLGKVKSFTPEILELKQVGDEYTFEGWASRPVIDRYNEIVDAAAFEGTLEQFALNPIMLMGHDPKQPIGHFPKLHLSAEGLWVGGVIGHGFQPADTARAMVEQKILRAMSIGFRENKRGVVDKNGIYHIISLDLLEASLVAIPACQDALFSMDEHGKLTSIQLIDEDDTMLAPERLDALARKRGFVQVPEALVTATDEQLLEAIRSRESIVLSAFLSAGETDVTAKGAISYVKYPTLDPGTTWDAGIARAALRKAAESSDGTIDFPKYRAGFTYVVDGQADKLGGYKLPHHTADGGIKTNLRGCRAVVGVILGARGGVDIPADAKKSVYDHVARHIKDDFGAEVAPFKALEAMDETQLLAALDVTVEEIDSVLAEYELNDALLELELALGVELDLTDLEILATDPEGEPLDVPAITPKDSNDGHTHNLMMDADLQDGNCAAAGTPKHKHVIKGGKVLPAFLGGGKISKHPGKIVKKDVELDDMELLDTLANPPHLAMARRWLELAMARHKGHMDNPPPMAASQKHLMMEMKASRAYMGGPKGIDLLSARTALDTAIAKHAAHMQDPTTMTDAGQKAIAKHLKAARAYLVPTIPQTPATPTGPKTPGTPAIPQTPVTTSVETETGIPDFSALGEGCALAAREAKTAIDIATLDEQLKALRTQAEEANARAQENIEGLKKRLEQLGSSVDVLLKLEKDRLRAQVSSLSQTLQPTAANNGHTTA